MGDDKEKPTYEDLLARVYEQEQTIAERDAQIASKTDLIQQLEQDIEEKNGRINKLQGIIVDRIPASTKPPEEKEVKVKTSFADRYSEMISKNFARIKEE